MNLVITGTRHVIGRSAVLGKGTLHMKVVLENLTKKFPSRNKKEIQKLLLSTISLLKFPTVN